MHQRLDGPALNLQMDRTRLQQMGLTAFNVGQNVLVSLSGSSQTAPAFWLNPQNGVVYQHRGADAAVPRRLARRAAQHAGRRQRRRPAAAAPPQLLGNLVEATPARGSCAVVSRYNITPAIDVYVSVQGTDLASVARKVQALVDEMRPKLPRGSQVTMRGQVETMQASFIGLGVGLAMAIVLVYLLIVVNFQSWIDAAIIIAALPAALAGIAWMLFITGTTLSVPALTGAIMTHGRRDREQHPAGLVRARAAWRPASPPLSAALEAGATRIRPVLMTALAMIIGMIPMALGIGEGAEQNAPLGRAVIGGLLFATVSTLLLRAGGLRRRPPTGSRGAGRARAPAPARAAGARIRRSEAMSEERHADRHPPIDATTRAPIRRSGARSCAARASSPSSCSCCSRSAPAAPSSAASRTRKALEADTAEQAQAVREDRRSPTAGGAGQTLALPGTLQGFVQAPIAARASGYLKRWTQGHRQPRREGRAARRDRDARDRPAALAGGRRARSRRPPSLELAKSTVERWESAAQEGRGLAAGARRAPQRRRAGAAPTSPPPTPTSSGCASCEGFKRVVAPFSGVITRRNVDVGDLIDAGGGAGRGCSCSRRPTRCASTSTCRSPTRSS